jgi:predicted Zn finger-like uncharacterized protein
MRIVCPSCQAAYEVPEALLGAGARRLRCARCANEWVPDLPAAAVPAVVEPPPPALPPPEPPEERLEPRPFREPRVLPSPRVEGEPPPFTRHRQRQFPVLGSAAVVLVSLVVLAGLGWAVYTWRGDLMQAWPPSERLFAVLGLR